MIRSLVWLALHLAAAFWAVAGGLLVMEGAHWLRSGVMPDVPSLTLWRLAGGGQPALTWGGLQKIADALLQADAASVALGAGFAFGLLALVLAWLFRANIGPHLRPLHTFYGSSLVLGLAVGGWAGQATIPPGSAGTQDPRPSLASFGFSTPPATLSPARPVPAIDLAKYGFRGSAHSDKASGLSN